MRGNVLIIDDERFVYENIKDALPAHNVKYAESLPRVNNAFSKYDIDLVMVDLNIKVSGKDRFSGLDYIKILRKRYPWVAIVVHSGYRDVERIITAIKNGADEYFYKGDLDLYSQDFRKKINQLVNQKKKKDREREALKETLVGHSPQLKQLKTQLQRIARDKEKKTFFLIGEEGVEKENVLHHLHKHSLHTTKSKPWVLINLSIWRKDDLMKIMHRKGGEKKQHFLKRATKSILYVKHFEHVDRGIQEGFLEMAHQSRYLKSQTALDTQFVFDLSSSPQKLFQEGKLSAHLYEEITQVRIPPLRDRLMDIPDLIAHWFEAKNYASGLLGEELRSFYERYTYPGNYAELHQLLGEMMDTHNMHYPNHNFQKSKILKKLPLIEERSLPIVLFEGYMKFENMEEEVAKIHLGYIEKALQTYKGRKGKVAGVLNAKSADNLKKTYIDKYKEKFPALIMKYPMIVKCYKLS